MAFGGDTNWKDSDDGPVPLPTGWSDAWVSCHPGNAGYTYDEVENSMIVARSPLRRERLDRFLLRLSRLEVLSIRRVGMEPIPYALCSNAAGTPRKGAEAACCSCCTRFSERPLRHPSLSSIETTLIQLHLI